MRHHELNLIQLCADCRSHQVFLLGLAYERDIFTNCELMMIIEELGKLHRRVGGEDSLSKIQEKMDKIPKNVSASFIEKQQKNSTAMYNYFMKEDKT